MLTRMFSKFRTVLSILLLTQAFPLVAIHAGEPVRIFAAGSLVAPLREAIKASGLAAEAVGEPVFGPAGLLRQRLEEGAFADIFLSADLAQPRKLMEIGRASFIVPFVRNKLCVFSRESLV
jgi:molybdate transport system substrate-binding protein